ncbi:hypothetical protein HanXRQr2_Chr16g0724601 [Helianthus annuus]|uniref:Uncharacterized protein n=1 Tax=Helianthus annuus TaxID=4232 RepID=A0A251RV82_HELAN|nr:hypothetical protein HanXRQr2_Chr16g0724601 [Helianthus annuus]
MCYPNYRISKSSRHCRFATGIRSSNGSDRCLWRIARILFSNRNSRFSLLSWFLPPIRIAYKPEACFLTDPRATSPDPISVDSGLGDDVVCKMLSLVISLRMAAYATSTEGRGSRFNMSCLIGSSLSSTAIRSWYNLCS